MARSRKGTQISPRHEEAKMRTRRMLGDETAERLFSEAGVHSLRTGQTWLGALITLVDRETAALRAQN